MASDDKVPVLRSSLPAVDIPGFFDNVSKALTLYVNTEAPPDSTSPTLVHEWPRERLARPDDIFDVITYRTLSSEMAPTMKDGTKPRGPKTREVKDHPELAGFNVEIVGWWELVQAEFTVWSKSSRNSDLVANWFHVFMMRYAFVYKFFNSRGVQNFRFVKRQDDEIDLTFGQEVFKRRLVYEFRLESLIALEQKKLTDIDINYGITGPDLSIEIKSV